MAVEILVVDVGGDAGFELLEHVGEVSLFAFLTIVIFLGDHPVRARTSIFAEPLGEIHEIVHCMLRRIFLRCGGARNFRRRSGDALASLR